jgi:hypothetical protein
VDAVEVPVPADRTAEFFALYAQWLAAPAHATWTCEPPPAPERKPWDPQTDRETAAVFWAALSKEQRLLVEAVCRAPIDCDQLAVAAGLAGPVATVQEIATVNAVAAAGGRSDVVLVAAADGALIVDAEARAKQTLTH